MRGKRGGAVYSGDALTSSGWPQPGPTMRRIMQPINEEPEMPKFLTPHVSEDADPQLCEDLRELARRYGPMEVALIAANMTDPNLLIESLAGNEGATETVLDEISEAKLVGAHIVNPRGPEEEPEGLAQGELNRLRVALRNRGYTVRLDSRVVDYALDIISDLTVSRDRGIRNAAAAAQVREDLHQAKNAADSVVSAIMAASRHLA